MLSVARQQAKRSETPVSCVGSLYNISAVPNTCLAHRPSQIAALEEVPEHCSVA
ncbi:hypothetical protein CBOM_01277 [Ceraceosorus bombacis]|uniref:Uncharacterized protein n=1 Tax=Ceraceosorus bombacis TaxID=401625 RepID=A0A0N7L9B8_9BASI|nr:hypothetical protein CBOM_01277 [Ceraceosorus bombacis]